MQTSKNNIRHQVWKDPQGLTTVCIADERGDECRKSLEHGSKLVYTFYARSHYEAMTIYYKFMNWRIYTTEFETDKQPYNR